MTKRIFDDVAEGLREAISVAAGTADPSTYRLHVPSDIDVRAIRKALRLTQTSFAERFGFNPARIRDWEQGRSRPDAALRAYLMVIQKAPKVVEEALGTGPGH